LLMKKCFAFLSSFFLLLVLDAQTTIIWEEQFDGGIPASWEIGPGTPLGATWQWSASGKADSAFLLVPTSAIFWNDKEAIQSPSVSNGVAMYNSDVYDSGGISAGSGPYPGFHSGSLTSPSIDLSEWSKVSLKFNQYASANAANTPTQLEISTDGGDSWTNIPINPEVILNQSTSPDDVQLIELSDLIAQQPNVKIRFTWSGRFYFWLIDDIQLIETPANNLALGSKIGYPASSFAQPQSQITSDSMNFYANISNLGSSVQTNVVLKAWIENPLGEVIFADSAMINELPAEKSDSLVQIENVFVPETLTTGNTYTVHYKVYTLDAPDGDFDSQDNSFSTSFLVTESLFSKDDGIGLEGVSSGGDWMFANLYQINPNHLLNEEFKAGKAIFSASRNITDGPLDGEQITIFLFKVKEEVLPDWSNFNLSSIGQDDDLEIVGLSSYTFPEGYQNFLPVEVALTDVDQLDSPYLEAGKRYLLAISYEGSANNILHAVDVDINYYQVSSLVYSNGQWSLEGFGPDKAAQLQMEIDLVTIADELPLPDYALNLFPNPASDFLNIEVKLESPSDALLIFADSSGQVLTYKEIAGLEEKTIYFDLSNYPAGPYLIRLVTPEGSKTKMFMLGK